MEIYLVKNRITGKCYIGKTSQGVAKRWKQHIYESLCPRIKLPRNNYFYSSIRKYSPENFEVFVLCICPDNETANISERFLIWSFGTSKKSLGYNTTLGGDGREFPEEVRKKMSLAKIGKKTGPASEERKRKIGLAHKGKPKPWLKGKPLHKNTFDAMILANSKPKSEEHKRKISETLKRKHKEKYVTTESVSSKS